MDVTLTQQTYRAISCPDSPEHESWGWERFDRRFRPRIFYHCSQKLNDADAEDCTATVMAKMPKEAPGFYDRKKCEGEKHRFKKFLLTIVNNEITSFQRCEASRRVKVQDLSRVKWRKLRTGFIDATGAVDEDWMDNMNTKVALALKELRRRRKPSTVDAFLKAVTTEMTPEELVAETGLTEANLRQICSRCLRELQEFLTNEHR